MGLSIRNAEVERLVAEIVRLTGASKTEVVRQALVERHRRLALGAGQSDRATRARRYLEREVWPLIPPGELGRRLSRAEEDAILGHGPTGT